MSKAKENYPVTPAVRALRQLGIAFTPHLYDYEERGGTTHSAKSLGVDEHAVIKTLVMEDDTGKPLIVLMHGDREVSTQSLARHINAKRITPCAAENAEKQTGYQVGGTSPFGTKKSLPIYAERTIFELEKIYINGGKRGFLVEITAHDLRRALKIVAVEVCR